MCRQRNGNMQRKPREVNPIAMRIAELIDRKVAERCGSEATFEEQEEIAAAVVAEVAVQLAGQAPKAGR